MVMAEKRLDKIDQRLGKNDQWMEQFNKKLSESFKELKEFRRIQNDINKYFLKEIKKNSRQK